MLGFYNYTVFLTYFGMLISFVGITFVMNGEMRPALICLMISGICDMFDGKIASTKTRTVREKRQNQTEESRKVYLGLPVTTVVLILPLLVSVGSRFAWPVGMIGPVLLIGIGIAFITPFQIKKPGLEGKIGLLIFGVAEFVLLTMCSV